FAQAVGRFVRVRRRGEIASVFLPSIPVLLEYASEMERERDHVLDRPIKEDDGFDPEQELLNEARKKRDTPDAGDELPFETMESAAEFDRALYDGGEIGGGEPDEEEFLGLPGRLEPDQVAVLLRRRRQEQAARRTERTEPQERQRPEHEVVAELRRELNSLVGAWHHRTGQPHATIHTQLRRACGGPPVAQATAEQLRRRIAKLRAWAVGEDCPRRGRGSGHERRPGRS